MSVEQKARERAEKWTRAPYDQETQQQARQLIDQGGDALIDAFYQDLDFGTGGLRGIMGVGTNRVNRYTLGLATQGLANYLEQQLPGKKHRVAIAFDSRNNSKKFASEIADVLAANGAEVFLFEDLRPTPELSFAIRHLSCDAGIVITASHNPPEYNGYKVYWNDGGQLVPPHDRGVIAEVRKVTPEAVKYGGSESLIHLIGEELDQAYTAELIKQCLTNDGKQDLKVVFTPIHGTSITAMPGAMEAAGFSDVHIVEEQATPDGNFPTVESPNPEEAAALDMALKLAQKIDADMVIGTDPDSDRVGIAVRNLSGELELLNGNQAASVLIYYCLERWRESGRLTGKEFVAKTIVTTDLIDQMAKAYEVDCPNVLTGFKWIAHIIRQKEGEKQFIVGGEESYGYMVGDFVRDKDAIASGVMLAEAAAWAKAKGSSFFELLIEVYQKFGFYLESLVSLKKEGHKGAEEIKQMMEDFRHKTPKSIAGESLVEMRDYQSSEITDLKSGAKRPLDIPKSNVVQFFTDQGSKITARPSGTEPKIKFYISVNTRLSEASQYLDVRRSLEDRIASIKRDLGL